MKVVLFFLWIVIAMIAAVVVLVQFKNGKEMTPREIRYFLFGLFIGGFPLVINAL